jgi:F-type H+-transporting ATPase subunit delta
MKKGLVSGGIIEPYAEAIMAVAQEHNLTQEFGETMRGLQSLCKESPEMREFIENPVIKPEDHKAVLQQICGDDTNQYLKNLLMLLVDKRRITFLPGICEKYLELLRQQTNTVLAEVTATTDLNESQEQAIRDKVKAMTNAAEVELKISINPELIGGVIVKVGSQVLDASLRGQLRRIGLSLSA